MKKFVLIDGNAIIHRAFHALPPLTDKEGNMTNAVYGFFSMFLKIVQDVKPSCIATCFDRPKPTFRQSLYAGYQAKRPKMDMELPPQIKIIHEILEKSGFEIFEIDGYEADDIIGTLSKRIVDENPDWEVVIVSGDRDLLQLVNGRVKVLAPIIGITKMIMYDKKTVEEKFGIKPSQIIDYKALVGDASDNYPGVTGVGPKTASELIKRYETLEDIYKKLEEIKKRNPNLALKLANGAESAGIAKKLATIILDTPVSFDLNKCNISESNFNCLEESFKNLGFKSLLGRLPKNIKENQNQKSEDKKSVKMQDKKEEKDKQLDLL